MNKDEAREEVIEFAYKLLGNRWPVYLEQRCKVLDVKSIGDLQTEFNFLMDSIKTMKIKE